MTTQHTTTDPRPGARVCHTLVRVSWGRRLECGLALVALAARVTLTRLVGAGAAGVVLAFGTALLIWSPAVREWLARTVHNERVERTVTKAVAASGVLGGRDVAVDAIRPVPAGHQLSLWVPPGTSVSELQKGEELLAVAFGARNVTVERDPARAGRAVVTVSFVDPLGGPPRPWPWTGTSRTDFWAGLPLGHDEAGEAVWLSLIERHLLIGGEPGGGKSNALSLVTAAAALDPTAELWLFDGKLVELSAWRAAATRFVGADLHEATAALDELRAEMVRRYELLLACGLRKVTPGMGLGPIVVVVDELALYLHGTGKAGSGFAEALRDLVARGRAAGVVVVAATQKPASDVVPTSLRDLFGYRLAMRCATRDASDTILGSGWATAGYTASDIDPTTRGTGLLLAEGGIPRRLRVFHLDDDGLARTAACAARLRREDGAR
jgi:hypothetical protein